VVLTGKVIDTLTALVQHHGSVVEKEQLLNTVWPNTVVEEANLTQNISILRKILGDNPKDHKFVATVAGRGYCFVGPVFEIASESAHETEPAGSRFRFAASRAGRVRPLGLGVSGEGARREVAERGRCLA
jgi:DNA-binding winged helix-turn-helix (wHTH) protein